MKDYAKYYYGIDTNKYEILDIVIEENQDTLLFKNRIKPECCSLCGSINLTFNKYRNLNIKHSHFTLKKCNILLKQRVFKCNDCNKYFTESNDLQSLISNVSKETIIYVLDELKKTQSFKDIATRANITSQTVINIFEKYVDCPRGKLPEVLSIDEFKNEKESKFKYACLLLDHNEKKVVDVLPTRRLDQLQSYFNKIPRKEKENVKYVVSDMYEGYKHLAGFQLPNAIHVVDAFHYIRYVTEAFNKVRIRIQKNYNTKSIEYYILKTFWKLLLKCSNDTNMDKPFFKKRFNREVTNREIIDMALKINNELKEAYYLKDKFIIHMRNTKEEDGFKFVDYWINNFFNSTINEFNKLSGLFKHWRNGIANSFIRDYKNKRYSNGLIEGINGKIKTIKKVSYGYNNFLHFRNRIMYIINNITYITNNPTNKYIFRKKRKPYKK